jgi:hypothetical protein
MTIVLFGRMIEIMRYTVTHSGGYRKGYAIRSPIGSKFGWYMRRADAQQRCDAMNGIVPGPVVLATPNCAAPDCPGCVNCGRGQSNR